MDSPFLETKIKIIPVRRTLYLSQNCRDFAFSLNRILRKRQEGLVVGSELTDSGLAVTVKIISLLAIMKYVVSFASALYAVGEKFTVSVNSDDKAWDIKVARFTEKTSAARHLAFSNKKHLAIRRINGVIPFTPKAIVESVFQPNNYRPIEALPSPSYRPLLPLPIESPELLPSLILTDRRKSLKSFKTRRSL